MEMIQIDIPMPERCGVCFAMHTDEIGLESWCGIDETARDLYTADINTKRPEWCPLKEQEAVAPYQHDAVWLCGNCEKEVVGWDDDIDGKEYRYPFCRQCGKAVKWDG